MQEYMLQKRGHKSVEAPEKDKVMKSIRTIIQEKEEQKLQKKNAVFMYGISSFMVVVVLVIGINLMNSYEKMKNLDQSLNTIALQMSNMNDNSGDNAAEVSGGVVSVNKLDGNVYPTETETQTQMQTASQTQQNTASQQSSGSSSITQQTIPTGTQASQETESQEAASEEAAAEPEYESYIVKSGDTIMNICKRHYGDISKFNEIIELNDLENADQLYVGQEIKLP